MAEKQRPIKDNGRTNAMDGAYVKTPAKPSEGTKSKQGNSKK